MRRADLDASALQPAVEVSRFRWSGAGLEAGSRQVPEETPIAIVHDASTSAVMMATPADLEDFAVGFSFTEGLIRSLSDIRDLEVVESDAGIELRLWLAEAPSTALVARRRRMVGPTGCGLCGVESLEQAVRPPRRVDSTLSISPRDVETALAALVAVQPLGAATRAVHAAGYWDVTSRQIVVREDVGRHNALDKLVGARLRSGGACCDGAVVLTSRVSVEMVQKAAAAGAPVLIAVSAPTALAVRTADEAGITLIAVARADGFEVYSHPQRLIA